MQFLIQRVNGQIVHDFSFFLLEGVRYQNWLRGSEDFTVAFSEAPDVPGCVPVGSVEFVSAYLLTYFGAAPLPRNVPETLFPFAGRALVNGTERDLSGYQFVKSNDTIKGFAGFVDTHLDAQLPAPGNYQISAVVDIASEYRCFVFKGVLVGAKHYSGDFRVFPDLNTVDVLINAFSDAPVAYTLDVLVNDKGTFVLEVHDFFACGLYGFADHKVLPLMFSQWFHEYVRSLRA